MTKKELLKLAAKKRLYHLHNKTKRQIAQSLIDSPHIRGKSAQWAFCFGVGNGKSDTQLPFHAHSFWNTLYALGFILGRITKKHEK